MTPETRVIRSSLSCIAVAAILASGCGRRAGGTDAGELAGDAALDAAIDLPPIRPIAPLSTSTVTSRRPTLRWELGRGVDGARVEICRDRACATVLTTLDATGTSAAPASDLPTGAVYWRCLPTMGSVVVGEPGPTWQFHVGARSAPVDTSWGTTLDVNGDGHADLAVAVESALGTVAQVHVYFGAASGLEPTPAVTLPSPNHENDDFGHSIASAGDVNGDGYADLVVGAYSASDEGRAHVYLGGSDGPSTTPASTLGGDSPLGELYFGYSVSSAGDVNGDGYADVVVGAEASIAPGHTENTGRAYVYFGSGEGVASTPSIALDGLDGSPEHFGASVAAIGDLNGDGYGDIVVGSPTAGDFVGRAHVYLGSASGPQVAAVTSLTGPDGPDGLFGEPVASAGDVNGDGLADLVVGAPEAGSRGRAHVYFGSAAGIASTPSVSLSSPDVPEARFGRIITSVGDTNGDGWHDLAIALGTPEGVVVYAGSDTGPPVAPTIRVMDPDGVTLGAPLVGSDVNGDGHDDLAAMAWDLTRGHRFLVFAGSASGLAAIPTSTASVPLP